MRVADKIALVTGGARGIGAACARSLAREGATVFVSDISPEAPDDMADFPYARHDVSVAADWQRVVARIVEEHGRIDILVNNAGIEGDTKTRGLATTEEDWERVLSVNLTGTFLGCRTVVPQMILQGTGSVILMASAASFMATPDALAYGTSKGAVAHLTRSVAMLGARGSARVRCNSVHPGPIATQMSDNLVKAIAAETGAPESSIEERIRNTIPFGERGQPEDVAEMVLYLASDESRFVTGAAFGVDGGWAVRSAT